MLKGNIKMDLMERVWKFESDLTDSAGKTLTSSVTISF